jgi:hypothetical protein
VYFQDTTPLWPNPDPSPGCITVSMIDGAGNTSTVISAPQPRWQFACQQTVGSPPQHMTGLTPGPARSVSANRAYWWNGSELRWLDRSGNQGGTAFKVPDQVGIEFAVSPDDSRIVITEIGFGKLSLHRTTWIEDLGTHLHKVVLFDADLTSANNEAAGWPWGWRGPDPVLYDFPTCVAGLGGDQFFALNHPRVVDHITGNRLVSFPECYGGTITDGGAFCTSSFTARTLDWFGWDEKLIKQFPLLLQTVACDSDLNPAKTSVLASCQPNIYTQQSPVANNNNGPRQYQFGSGPQLPVAIANAPVRWLDDDLLLAPGYRAAGSAWIHTMAIWSLTSQKQLVAPVDVLGNQIGRLAAIK